MPPPTGLVMEEPGLGHRVRHFSREVSGAMTTGAVPKSLALRQVVDLQEDGDRVAPCDSIGRALSLDPQWAWGNRQQSPPSSIPLALRVSWESVAAPDTVGYPWGLAAVGVLAG